MGPHHRVHVVAAPVEARRWLTVGAEPGLSLVAPDSNASFQMGLMQRPAKAESVFAFRLFRASLELTGHEIPESAFIA